ncbi:EpsG family protein [Paenibacillus doosanensis]|uniref:EpsG family protein n=1 Tax=Paenibacillus doosanensis TaxID=1229154 RepID=UPI00217F6990|nr:EpsG family protein [Paenibacillus doosanensis]MCS7461028.1 EpsG family protein [Paenibacillus doosanensis]
MAVLYVNIALAYIFSLCSRWFVKPSSVKALKPNILLAFFAVATLVLVSGLRNNIGDTYYYMYSYRLNNFTWETIRANKDIGFGLFQMGLKQISDNPQILVFSTALITNVLIIWVLYRYSKLFELSVYLYIACGLYTVSMNGIRQFMAGAIVFAATKYIYEGNWKKYICVVLFASTIHQSAFILIPIYFIVRRKAWTGASFALLFSAVFLAMGYGQFSNLLFSAIQDTQYSNYKDFQEGGANVIRLAVQAVPVVFAFLGRDKLRQMDPRLDYIVNMCILGVVFMVIATQNWIFARFIVYFGLYNLILLSWIVHLFVKREQKFIYYSIVVLYFGYFYYENVISLHMYYSSDYLK